MDPKNHGFGVYRKIGCRSHVKHAKITLETDMRRRIADVVYLGPVIGAVFSDLGR